MKPVTETRERGERGKNSSLKATWRAIRSLPLDHFPLILPDVYPIAGPFILWRLKRMGFSNCRVVSKESGLLVFADR